MMQSTIVVIGSSNTDMIVKTSRIPAPGETVLGGRFVTAPGGKGANQAVAAARAGGDIAFVARVGTDSFGDEAVEGFRRAGIDTRFVFRDSSEPSGVAFIVVDAGGENSITVAPGANSALSIEDICECASTIGRAGLVLMQLEIPLATVEAAAEAASDQKVRTILDPAPARALPDSLLAKISVLTPNETEAEMLTGIEVTGEGSAGRAADRLLSRGVENVLITMGGTGIYAACPDFKGMIPAFNVEAVDTTAAGDVFNGVLAARLARGGALHEAAEYAAGAAAISVTRLGAQPSAPTREELESFMQSQIDRFP